MKVHNLTKSVLLALTVASPLVGAETQYPAADFKPEIIKQDAELIAKHAGSSATSQPVKTESKAAPAPAAPAAKVETKPVAKPEASAAPTQKPEEPSNLPIILAGAAIGIGAFLFLKRKPKCDGASAQPAPQRASAAAATTGTTGVAKYISALPETSAGNETGVSRYIKSLPPAAPSKTLTGVEKYLKTLPTAASSAAAPAAAAAKGATGVEKYISALPEKTKPAGETGVTKYLKSQGLAA